MLNEEPNLSLVALFWEFLIWFFFSSISVSSAEQIVNELGSNVCLLLYQNQHLEIDTSALLILALVLLPYFKSKLNCPNLYIVNYILHLIRFTLFQLYISCLHKKKDNNSLHLAKWKAAVGVINKVRRTCPLK